MTYLETQGSEAELALEKIDSAFNAFTSFYGRLVEKGINETKYGKVFADITAAFQELYATAKSNYDALRLNSRQFEEGRLEKDAFERSLARIKRYIIKAEFDIGVKILPYLKKAEKEMLHDHIVKPIETTDMPKDDKQMAMEEVKKIETSMRLAEKKGPFDQINEYVGAGEKIIEVGEIIRNYADKTAPVGQTTLSLGMFGAP